MQKIGLIVVVVALFALSAASPASAVLYTFSGAGGLAGTFTLDETTSIVGTQEQLGTAGLQQSPLNHLEGTFGAFTFSGTPVLTIFDVLNDLETSAQDSWILRAGPPLGPPLTSSSINGLTVTGLNLFIYTGNTATMPFDFTVPPHESNPFDFQYTIAFSDGSFVAAPLTTLVFVPEPSTIALLALGVVATGVAQRRHRAGSKARS